jgi:hypothetical protein
MMLRRRRGPAQDASVWSMTDVLSQARDWLAEDPDPQTRAELSALN